jgi:hypothetical protein
MNLRAGQATGRPAVGAFLAQRGAARVARRNQLVDPLDHPALLAEDEQDGRLLGVLTYVIDRDRAQCEVLTIDAVQQWRGVAAPCSGWSRRWRPGRAAAACGWSPPTTTSTPCASTSGEAFALPRCTVARWTTAGRG